MSIITSTQQPFSPQIHIKDKLYEILKLAIASCEFPPGTNISEGYLADLYSVGKAPVRDALSRLGQDGWVRSVPRIGHVVTSVTKRDVLDVFSMRELLEPESAARAAGHLSQKHLLKLNADCANSYQLTDICAKRRFLTANWKFHTTIANASGSPRLARTVTQLHDESLRVLYLSVSARELSEDWSEGHKLMIAAIANGDGRAAYDTTLEGIQRSRDRVMTVFESSPEMFSDAIASDRLSASPMLHDRAVQRDVGFD